MLNTFHKLSRLILIFSAIIVGWTSIILISDTTLDLEIKEVIYKMYLSQRNFIFNVKDLSLLLLKDANYRFSENHHDNKQINNRNN